MKTDKHIRDISDRLDRISSNDYGNGRGDIDFEDYDDEYYLEVGSEPLICILQTRKSSAMYW